MGSEAGQPGSWTGSVPQIPREASRTFEPASTHDLARASRPPSGPGEPGLASVPALASRDAPVEPSSPVRPPQSRLHRASPFLWAPARGGSGHRVQEGGPIPSSAKNDRQDSVQSSSPCSVCCCTLLAVVLTRGRTRGLRAYDLRYSLRALRRSGLVRAFSCPHP